MPNADMVTVVIPNYNYKRFLKKRLNSVLNQTCRHMDILFLDDASDDGSVPYARRILEKSDIPYRIIQNSSNSGSVFKQWERGLELTRSEFIWFAEADDYCAPDFLEKVMAPLKEDRDVVLSYSDSAVVNERGRPAVPGFYKGIHGNVQSGKWESDYRRNGIEEIEDSLAVKNTIPNASAVVMKVSALKEAGGIASDMVLSGDWLTYIRLLGAGKIAYTARCLNTNRIHPQRVTAAEDKGSLYFQESAGIMKEVLSRYNITDETRRKYLWNLMDQAQRRNNGSVGSIMPALYQIFSESAVKDEYAHYLAAASQEKESSRKDLIIPRIYRRLRYVRV